MPDESFLFCYDTETGVGGCQCARSPTQGPSQAEGTSPLLELLGDGMWNGKCATVYEFQQGLSFSNFDKCSR